MTLLQRWFPSFLNYAGTVMNDMLPRDADDDRNDVDLMVALPEEALMDDLDRVVQHCLMDTKLVKVDEEEEAGGEGGEGGDDLDDALGSEAKLAGRLADMLKGEEGGGAGAGGAGGGAGGGQQYVTCGGPRESPSTNKRKQHPTRPADTRCSAGSRAATRETKSSSGTSCRPRESTRTKS